MRQKSKLEKERKEKKNVFCVKGRIRLHRGFANGFLKSNLMTGIVESDDSLQLFGHLFLYLLGFLTSDYCKVFSLVGIDDGTA